MSDLWLPYQDRHARWDDEAEQIVIVGWRPGPAGVSSFDITATMRIVLDHASPTTLTELLVHAPGGRIGDDDMQVLRRLLGDDIVAMLAIQPKAPRPTPLRPLRLVTREPFRRYDDIPDERALHLARLVLASDAADNDDLRPVVRAIARFEAAQMAFSTEGLVGPREAHVLAARALEDLARLRMEELDPRIQHDLRGAVTAARARTASSCSASVRGSFLER